MLAKYEKLRFAYEDTQYDKPEKARPKIEKLLIDALCDALIDVEYLTRDVEKLERRVNDLEDDLRRMVK